MPPLLGTRRPQPLDFLEPIEEAAAQGTTIPSIAVRIGVSKTALYDWLERGATEREEGRSDEPGSLTPVTEALERGIARYEEARLANIREAESPKAGGWQPSAWLLERSPYTKERYAQRTDAHVEQRSVNVQITIAEPSTDKLDAARDALAIPERVDTNPPT